MEGEPQHRIAPGEKARRAAPRVVTLVLFAVVALAMLGAVALIFGTVQAERDARAQAQRTSRALDTISAISEAAINAETGQRGFLLTSDERYLRPYQLGRERFPAAVERLQVILGRQATPRQEALMAEIERLGTAKFAEMADTIALVRDGRPIDAQMRILSDEGQLAMERLRVALEEFETIEQDLLVRSSARAAQNEARIVPLLAALLAIIVVALVFGVLQLQRGAHAEAAAAQAASLAAARDRADLLAQELNHRVKNLFTVVLAIVRMSARDEPAAQPLIDKIAQRIRALLKAHEVTQGDADDAVVELGDLVRTAIAPYRTAATTCTIEGEALRLPGRIAGSLGLVIHELVTNAVKYGAWSQPGGVVRVEWEEQAGQRVLFTWREEGERPPPPPAEGKREGFGSILMRSSARQLGGTIDRTAHDAGIEVRMEFSSAV